MFRNEKSRWESTFAKSNRFHRHMADERKAGACCFQPTVGPLTRVAAQESPNRRIITAATRDYANREGRKSAPVSSPNCS